MRKKALYLLAGVIGVVLVISIGGWFRAVHAHLTEAHENPYRLTLTLEEIDGRIAELEERIDRLERDRRQ